MLVAAWVAAAAAAPPAAHSNAVFRASSNGYETFRIPGLLTSPSHTPVVVALAEGRSRLSGPAAPCGGPAGMWTNNVK